jgi:tetratricopeptide (TPR) repeat protein
VEEANRELARALKLDPLSVYANFVSAYSLMSSGRLDEAIAQYRRTLELKSIHPDMYWDYGMALGLAGRHKEAEEAIRKSKEARGEPAGLFGPLELWLSGRRDEAQAALPAFEKRAREGRHSRMDAARTFSMMGETEKAFEWLRRAVESRESQAFWIRVDPRFRGLHSDPRYQELVRRVGLDSRP